MVNEYAKEMSEKIMKLRIKEEKKELEQISNEIEMEVYLDLTKEAKFKLYAVAPVFSEGD
jgi:hypothetical protein